MNTNHLLHLVVLVGIGSILAVGMTLAVGFAGLLNFGHVAFFGIGAYVSSLLLLDGWSFLAAAPAAAVAAGVSGVALALVAGRLRGEQLALACIGFNGLFYTALTNWSSLTGGPQGLMAIPRPSLGGFVFDTPLSMTLLVAGLAAIVLAGLARIARSHRGLLWQALRDDEIRLSHLGFSPRRLKAEILALAGASAGIAGSLFACDCAFIDPSAFTLGEVSSLLTMVVIGGTGSLRGSLAGAAFVVLLPEALRFVSIPPSVVGPLRQMIYATILMAVLLFRPRGLFGKVTP